MIELETSFSVVVSQPSPPHSPHSPSTSSPSSPSSSITASPSLPSSPSPSLLSSSVEPHRNNTLNIVRGLALSLIALEHAFIASSEYSYDVWGGAAVLGEIAERGGEGRATYKETMLTPTSISTGSSSRSYSMFSSPSDTYLANNNYNTYVDDGNNIYYPTQSIAVLAFGLRFVTSFAAPSFFFLMGLGMMLYYHKGHHIKKFDARTILFLQLLRGTIMIICALTISNGGLYRVKCPNCPSSSEIGFYWLYLQTLWAAGICYVIALPLMKIDFLLSGEKKNYQLQVPLSLGSIEGYFNIPTSSCIWFITACVLTYICSYIDSYTHPSLTISQILFFLPGSVGPVVSVYPAIPWLIFVLLGLVAGRVLLNNDHQKTAGQGYLVFAMVAVLSFFVFVVVRCIQLKNNSHPVPFPYRTNSIINFFGIVVQQQLHPPSLAHITLTVTFVLVFTSSAYFAKFSEKIIFIPCMAYGQSSLVFIVVHAPLVYGFGYVFHQVMGITGGGGLVITFVVWSLVLVIMFVICYFFNIFKKTTPYNSIYRLL